MSCDRYQERELGRLDESAFQAHLKDCDICRERLRQDEAIDELAGSLAEVTEPPFLWERIEDALRAEQRRARRRTWDAEGQLPGYPLRNRADRRITAGLNPVPT